MESLGKKVGYLKGLMEGMSFDTSDANGKLIVGIVDMLGELCDRMESVDELLEDLNDYVESIDEDLSELEGANDDDYEDMFGDDDDDDDDYEDMFDDGEDKLHLLRPADPPEPEEESLAGNLCPKCNRMFFTSLKDAEGATYVCPHCGEKVRPMPLTPDNAPIAKPAEDE